MKSVWILMNTNGKAVQLWTFAKIPKPHIIYCQSPEWAMKFSSETIAARNMEFLKKHFPNENIRPMRVTITTSFTIG